MYARALLIMVMSASVAGPVQAEPSSLVAFDAQTRSLLRNADAERGRVLASEDEADCVRCHGEAGVVEADAEEPNIAGQPASYAYKQLKDYQDGKREHRRMKRAMKKIETDQQLADLAAYYQSLGRPLRAGKVNGVAVELVEKGDPKRLVRACNSCHGRDGNGGMYEFGALAGENPEYFKATMGGFRSGDRVNDIYSRMRVIAEALTDEEIAALAEYYAGEPAPAQEGSSSRRRSD